MANEYISQVQLPNNETYNIKDKEVVPRLKATVGHTCKNLLKITANTKTINGITFTVDKQAGTVTANGTASKYTAFGLVSPSSFYQERGMILSGCTGGSSRTYWIDTWDGSVQIQNFSGETSISTQSWTQVRIVIWEGTSVSNLVFKPMIRDGSISDDTFEPYQEPTDSLIETKARAYLTSTVGHACKNLLDLTKNIVSTDVTNIVIDPKTGSVSANASGSWKSIYFIDENIKFENGKTYVVSCKNNAVNTSGSLAIRHRVTNIIYKGASFNTLGVKSIIFTPNTTDLPNGWMISLFITNASGADSSIDISELMLKEVSISDDTSSRTKNPLIALLKPK